MKIKKRNFLILTGLSIFAISYCCGVLIVSHTPGNVSEGQLICPESWSRTYGAHGDNIAFSRGNGDNDEYVVPDP